MLVEGPAGTGKTRAILEKLWWIANEYPGARILLTRLERTRITRSVLVTFERDVIPPGHPCLRGAGGKRPTREGRHSYLLPNGSEFVVQGAQDIEGIKSQEYDVIYWNEITECPTHEPFEALHRALRSGPVPNRQLIADCNPNRPNHWILKRCQRGLCRRIFTTLKDNPLYWDAKIGRWTVEGEKYRHRLGTKTTGLTFRRLFLGEWCAADGLFFPEFAEHEAEFRPIPPPFLLGRDGQPSSKRDWSKLGIRWWAAGVDWGYTKPGSMSVWGFDGDKNAYRVAQIYRTQMAKEWWAKRAVEFVSEFGTRERPFIAFVADSAEPDSIALFNDHLTEAGYARICRPADKDFEANADIVRDGLARRKIKLLQDSQRFGREAELDESGKPCNTEEEWLELIYSDKVEKPHRAKDEHWDPLCEDHGTDETLYLLGWAWRREYLKAAGVQRFQPGSAGHILGHERKMKRALKRA